MYYFQKWRETRFGLHGKNIQENFPLSITLDFRHNKSYVSIETLA
jgi:ribosomal protein S17E